MRPEYKKLRLSEDSARVFDRFLNYFETKLFDESEDKYQLVCETLYRLETGRVGYNEALEQAIAEDNLIVLTNLLSMDPRNVAQEPEYYGDINLERYERNKPIHWLWTYFDKLPISRNTLFAFQFRRLLGRFMFKHLGENVKLFHNIEFTYGYNLTIEDNVVIHREVMLDDRGSIHIKKNASISDFAHVYSHHHHVDDIYDISLHDTIIGEGARVTYHATVLSGQSIGDYAILGSFGLATRPVDPCVVKGGIPAKQIGKVSPKNPPQCC